MKDALQKTDICITCPGSQWGDSNFCSIHQVKVFEVETCKQWEGKLYVEPDGQLTTRDPEKLLDILQRTESDVRDYHWMLKEIDRLDKYMHETSTFSGNLTAQYGEGAAMPRAQGSKPSWQDARSERNLKRQGKLLAKVRRIDQAAEKVKGEKERTVLENMLDGVRPKVIAQTMGISRQTLSELRNSVITQLANDIYREELERV